MLKQRIYLLYRLSDQQSRPPSLPSPTLFFFSFSSFSLLLSSPRRVCSNSTWIPPHLDFPGAASLSFPEWQNPGEEGERGWTRRVRGAGHHDERDCPFRTANTAIGFLSAGCRLPPVPPLLLLNVAREIQLPNLGTSNSFRYALTSSESSVSSIDRSMTFFYRAFDPQ